MNSPAPIVVVVSLLAFWTMAPDRQSRLAQEPSRQRPPEGFACARNDLTVYTGVVTRYRRGTGRTTLRIRTDWETTEEVTLCHAGSDDPSASFRYEGKPFTADDWARIEQSRGVLRPATRAAAWVCADGKVLVEWGVPRE